MDTLTINEMQLDELMKLLEKGISTGVKSKLKGSPQYSSKALLENRLVDKHITDVKSRMKKTPEGNRKNVEMSGRANKKDVSKKNKIFNISEYKNLNEFISDDESDSLESDYDEERGFTAADNFLTMNALSKELEKREKLINNALKESENELKMKKKSEEDKRKTLLALDNELKFDKKQFEDELMKFPAEDEDFKMKSEPEQEEVYGQVHATEDDENLQQELLKLVESLENRVKNYEFPKTNLENYYDPVDGITIHKLQNYFQRQMNEQDKETARDKENENNFREFNDKIDILYPLSTKEKRKQLEKLFSDIKSNTFQQIKYEHNEKIHTQFNHLFKQKIFTESQTECDDMLGSIELSKDRSDEADDDFEIMFSDLSTSGDEEDMVYDTKLGAKGQASFREKCDTVIQGLKENTRRQKRNISGLERLVNRYMKKYEADERREKEFARWFGAEETKEDKRSDEVPIWKPGWYKLDKNLKEEILKNGKESRRSLKKYQEGEPLEEYKNLLSEYEQFEMVECQGDDKEENIEEEEEVNEAGEKWIKIKKGTLMRDYQIRCRQGLYYLVEKKHIEKKQRKMLSKKRMIRANSVNVVEAEKKKIAKSKRMLSMKRYLGKKKVIKKEKQHGEKRMFTKRGEAIEEIRKILTHLESKPFDQKLKETVSKSGKTSEWKRATFIKYFKEKCREVGADVSSDDDEEIDDSRDAFRKYCILYYEKLQQIEVSKNEKKENEKYPLNLFKPKKINEENSGFESDGDIYFEETAIDTNEKFPIEDLVTEIFHFSIGDEIDKKDERQSPLNEQNIEFNHLTFHYENELLNEEHNKQKNKLTLPLHYSELFDLPEHIQKLVFRAKDSVDHEKIKKHLSDNFLTNEKHYIRAKPSNKFSKHYSEVIDEMRKENLIKSVNYKFLNDEEALFPWNEIKIEFEDIPIVKDIKEIKRRKF